MTVPLGFTLLLSLVAGCSPGAQGTRELSAQGWIDVTATLDPARTPVYEGDAPLKFDFLKDMRKGDKLTLSAYSLGAHSGTHIDAPMHFVATGAPIDQVGLDLRPVQAGDDDLIVLPLKVRGHEGAPARAIVRKWN